MSHIFARVFKQAQITFDRNNQQILARNLNLLKNLVSELSIIDLGLNPELASKRAFTSPDKAPCTYISIHENPEFTMSCKKFQIKIKYIEFNNLFILVFILRDSYTMPIHDHPRMNGILKIVSGSVRIQSYTRINPGNSEILVKSEPLQEISATDAVTSILSPEECNYHEITAIDGPAAFFDILSPPYSEYDYQNRDEHRRQCHFYSKSVKDSENQILKLDIIPVPSHYICDSVRYNFPFE